MVCLEFLIVEIFFFFSFMFSRHIQFSIVFSSHMHFGLRLYNKVFVFGFILAWFMSQITIF